MTSAHEVVLRAVDIAKTYGVTRALKGVNFEVRSGQVTVLFGENGAGKSTLMKILAGIEQPTAGHLEMDGVAVAFADSSDAVANGISMIHQELNLCANLNVRDNVFLGRELHTVTGTVDYAKEAKITEELMERLEEQISPTTLVQDLRVGQQQVVEIAKALSTEARVLIMDEPTSALSATEVEVLFKVIRELTDQGVAIVYISHHLEEALEIADQAVVFRDGDLVATAEASEIDLGWIVRQMVGRDAEYDFRDAPREFGEVVLRLEDVSVVDPATGRLAVDSVSLDVRAGEIVCIYGLMGAGRTELLEALAGKTDLAAGSVLLDGRDVGKLPTRERIAAGLGLVPEDRQRDGLIQLMSVGRNATLSTLPRLMRWLTIDSGRERRLTSEAIQDVRVKTASAQAPITSLSGGNQQKVVIAKMLMTDPKLLMLDEPTRGVDVGAKGEIFRLLFERAQGGLGVLYATSEISEALSAAHRVITMSRGRLVAEFDPRTCTREEVMASSDEQVSTTEPMGAPQ
ncbi:sugar ABC transporter ATP-binding protein [Tsukamurella asaccharolytica]|uniref:Sugar ABC transporter ATP-binding protein n=1 Tax=Tsukamurella asaccharolytica TaxID=2592067 RepID=A0A5C5R7J6_9ACTN|nr:sugar ABC transporter ATP-binding protein [Tsukamurella asaccharolytica]TWS18656.1 sugar ABC transporter ATP-binding protein [Tsukamurella asaccharolytica]